MPVCARSGDNVLMYATISSFDYADENDRRYASNSMMNRTSDQLDRLIFRHC